MKMHEHGQATMEVAAAAVAIIFVIIGFFTLGGVGVVSIKSLLLTREAAEKKACSAVSGGSEKTIAGWNYTTFQDKKNNDTFTVPFLAGDEKQSSFSSVSISDLDSDRWSAADTMDYVFLSYQDTPGISLQRAIYSGNSAALSMLCKQSAVLPDNMDGTGAFNTKFKDGWIDTRKIDITDWDSSTVFFPAFGPRK